MRGRFQNLLAFLYSSFVLSLYAGEVPNTPLVVLSSPRPAFVYEGDVLPLYAGEVPDAIQAYSFQPRSFPVCGGRFPVYSEKSARVLPSYVRGF